MADPDLQIRRGGGGGGHPDTEIRRGGLQNFFSVLRASFSSRNKGKEGGGGRGVGPSPGSATI